MKWNFVSDCTWQGPICSFQNNAKGVKIAVNDLAGHFDVDHTIAR